jgi:hypothetical protein
MRLFRGGWVNGVRSAAAGSRASYDALHDTACDAWSLLIISLHDAVCARGTGASSMNATTGLRPLRYHVRGNRCAASAILLVQWTACKPPMHPPIAVGAAVASLEPYCMTAGKMEVVPTLHLGREWCSGMRTQSQVSSHMQDFTHMNSILGSMQVHHA